jgi:chromate transporter
MVGDRFFGWRGAFAALAGLITLPFVIVLAATVLYAQFMAVPAVAGALKGMGAVATGLIAATALKLLPGLRSNPMGAPACILFGGGAFAAVVVLGLPLGWTLLGIGSLAYAFAWRGA